MNKEEVFHESRLAFMIIDDEILYLKNNKMSHKEWYFLLFNSLKNFNDVVRGYAKDDRIIYYKGDFEYDSEVIEVAKKTHNKIMDEFNNYNCRVFVGVIKGEIGEEWEPDLELNFNKKMGD